VANSNNLTPWTAGQSGNPSGKQKGTLNRATILKRYLSASLKDNPSDIPFELEGRITVEDAIALALIKKALSGDIAAIKEIQDTVATLLGKGCCVLTCTSMPPSGAS
jgi:hypothetical protein